MQRISGPATWLCQIRAEVRLQPRVAAGQGAKAEGL